MTGPCSTWAPAPATTCKRWSGPVPPPARWVWPSTPRRYAARRAAAAAPTDRLGRRRRLVPAAGAGRVRRHPAERVRAAGPEGDRPGAVRPGGRVVVVTPDARTSGRTARPTSRCWRSTRTRRRGWPGCLRPAADSRRGHVDVRHAMRLSREDVDRLIRMGPSAYHRSGAEREASHRATGRAHRGDAGRHGQRRSRCREPAGLSGPGGPAVRRPAGRRSCPPGGANRGARSRPAPCSRSPGTRRPAGPVPPG